jgi:hypothetical protein
MLNRTAPGASPNEAFTELDQYLLDELLPNLNQPPGETLDCPLCHQAGKTRRLSGPRS